MARNVYDVAVVLGVMTGVDPADTATSKSEGKFETDYTQFLDASALDGARLGIARDFMGQDGDVDWIIEASLDTLRNAGATIVDVELPEWLLEVRGEFYNTIRRREFRAQIAEYLATLGPSYPKTLAELLERSKKLTAPDGSGRPNPSRWSLLEREEESGSLEDFEYIAMQEHGLPLVRAYVEGIFRKENLDAILYPTSPRRTRRTDIDRRPGGGGGGGSATRFANLTGFPDLIVPAGFTGNGLPVTLSFLGTAFTEPRLLALGYAFEQATRARRLPVHTPPLPGETIRY
jgi:amidase